MVPRSPVPAFIAQALAERLGRPLDPAEIGMPEIRENPEAVGLDFHRDAHEAVHTATRFWSTMRRRTFVTAPFTIGASHPPTTTCSGNASPPAEPTHTPCRPSPHTTGRHRYL